VVLAIPGQVAIPFALEDELKVRGGDSMRLVVGSEFLFLQRWFSLDSSSGRGEGLEAAGGHYSGAVGGKSSNTRGQVLEERL